MSIVTHTESKYIKTLSNVHGCDKEFMLKCYKGDIDYVRIMIKDVSHMVINNGLLFAKIGNRSELVKILYEYIKLYCVEETISTIDFKNRANINYVEYIRGLEFIKEEYTNFKFEAVIAISKLDFPDKIILLIDEYNFI
jgi:hypothetical protein